MTALRRGEAPILARFEGPTPRPRSPSWATAPGFVCGSSPHLQQDRRADGRQVAADEDSSVRALHRRRVPSPRLPRPDRAPPSAEEVRRFLDDPKESRIKRDELVDRLIGSPDHVDYWTNKWADLLQVNRKFLDVAGASAFRQWIRQQVEENLPTIKLVRTILAASGLEQGQSRGGLLQDSPRAPTAIMENTTQLFLGVRFNLQQVP